MTTGGEFLSIEPSVIEFPFESMEDISCSLLLSNKTDHFIAFKVKTTAPGSYYCKPDTGFVSPRSMIGVTVTRVEQKMPPLDMQCQDKFLFQSVVTSPGITANDITSEMFNKEAGHNVDEVKLRVVYVGQDTSRKVLGIKHLDIEFPFELNKQIPCSLQLSNKTDNYRAFKFKTTNPKKYLVSPNRGVVTPQSTRNVTVIMQEQTEAPLDMLCNDKFLIQSMMASPGSTDNDITTNMFNKVGELKVKETKLRVVYVASTSVGESIEKDSSSDNESLYTPEPKLVFSSPIHEIEPENNPFTFNEMRNPLFSPSHVGGGSSTGTSLPDIDGSLTTHFLLPSEK